MSEAIDFSLLKGTTEESEAVSATLLKTLKTRGVAKLKNHGLPEDLISQLFDYVRVLFHENDIAVTDFYHRPVDSSNFHWRTR